MSFLFATVSANAQISKSNADNLVLHNIVNDSTKLVYGMNEGLGPGIRIRLADGEEIKNPYDSAYLYFIDDIPAANWAHNCRYCFVNVADSTYDIEYQMFCPSNQESFHLISGTSCTNSWQWPYTNYTIPQKAAINNKLYAVFIGGDPKNHAPIKIWYNLSCVYTALVNKYGFKESQNYDGKSNMLVIAHPDVKDPEKNNNSGVFNFLDLNQSQDELYDNDFIDSTIFVYSRDGIKNIFRNLSGEFISSDSIPVLSEEDQLFVFLSGHGDKSDGNSYFILHEGVNGRLYDYDLATWVRNIRCSQMTFFIDCCYSGGFVDNLMNDSTALCKNRVVHTATDGNHYGYVEQHITNGGNRNDEHWQRVDEFVYYWSAAILGYYPILEIHSDWLTGPWHQYDSTALGQFPWSLITSFHEGNGFSHTGFDINPDADNDGIVSMDEAFVFADNLDSYSHSGYFHPFDENYSFVEYPLSSYESTFTKELITLDGYRGKIDDTIETGENHSYLLAGDLHVANNASLTINDGCCIDGNDCNRSIFNNGSLSTASGVNNVVFKNVILENAECKNFSLTNCVFDTCGVISANNSPLAISNSIFYETRIEATANDIPRDPYSVSILNNTFNNTSSGNSIYLQEIYQCHVEGNTIDSGYNGVYIRRLKEPYHHYLFSNNTITNCNNVGFLSYNSNAILYNNSILNNSGGGLFSLNMSNLYVYGDSTATSVSDAQRFWNNGIVQIYATLNSYPTDSHYNSFHGCNTQNDTILLYESTQSGNIVTQFDVTKNSWGNLRENQIPLHLYTGIDGSFSYLPVWDLIHIPVPYSPPQRMLALGNNYVKETKYDEAKDIFSNIVYNYSESPEAIVALKALFSIEYVSEGNFSSLKNYYDGLTSNIYLRDVADYLSNQCDVVLGNYDDAIDWYEDKIVNPNISFSERIFAEIDLGDLYLKPDVNNRESLGRLMEYVPTSKESHAQRTNHLLSLLPYGTKDNVLVNNDIEYASCERVICYPNPIKNTMTISYFNNIETPVEICIINLLGEELKHIDIGCQNIGKHNYILDCSDIATGTYLCVIKKQYADNDVVKIIISH